jgi:TrmH family RNA methyltransferase
VISRARLKFLRSLSRKKVRDQEGLFVVEGFNLVEEAVATGHARELFFSDAASEHQRAGALRESGLPCSDLAAGDVAALAETQSPAGAFGLVESPWHSFDLGALPDRCLALLAAGVSDPGNLGTLVRSAAALGAAAVVTAPGTVEPLNAKVVRATAGALFRVPVVDADAAALKEAGFFLCVADAGGEPVTAWKERPARLALAVGSEPHGVDDSTRALADAAVAVPLQGDVESLNVTVAAGILLSVLRALPFE